MIADIAFLAVVQPRQLVQAQSRLELGQSAALVFGLSLAGWLIATFSVPVATLADSASFLLATALLRYVAMRSARNTSASTDHRDRQTGEWTGSTVGRLLGEAVEGALFTLRTSRLRAATFATGTFIFCYSAYSAVLMLYLTQDLGLTAAAIGAVTGIAAVGSAVGSSPRC